MHQTLNLASLPSWFHDGALTRVITAIHDAGGELRLVGGVVRDMVRGAISNNPPADIDAACTLPPEQVMQITKDLGFTVVPTGIAHGTVTVVLPDAKLEITTLRRDVSTDGRHAQVAFGTSFEEDSRRRDFTMNALYLDRAGIIHDYHDGIADAKEGRVRFIGEARARIEEDALRILRFYRFIAQVETAHIDAAAHDACTQMASMVSQLSGERIAQEMFKLLAQPDPVAALRALRQSGVCSYMELGAPDIEALIFAESLPKKISLHALLRLRIICCRHSAAEIDALANRWKLSNAQRHMLHALQPETLPALTATEWDHAAILRVRGMDQYMDGLITRAAYEGQHARDAYEKKRLWAEDWKIPAFSIQAVDLLAEGFMPGKTLGETLRALELAWENSQYELSHEEMLVQARAILRNKA